jgi:hypothetical protein
LIAICRLNKVLAVSVADQVHSVIGETKDIPSFLRLSVMGNCQLASPWNNCPDAARQESNHVLQSHPPGQPGCEGLRSLFQTQTVFPEARPSGNISAKTVPGPSSKGQNNRFKTGMRRTIERWAAQNQIPNWGINISGNIRGIPALNSIFVQLIGRRANTSERRTPNE